MIVIYVVMLVLLVGGWVVLNWLSDEKYRTLSKLPMEGLRLSKMVVPTLYILDKSKITTRFPFFFFKVQRSIQKVYGTRYSGEMTLLYLGEMMCYSWLLFSFGCVLSIGMGEETGLILGGVLGILLPVAMVKDLHKKVQVRDQDILMELPELLNKVVLLVGAGETVQKAIAHCVERKKDQQDHPLYKELIRMVGDWDSGYSFQQSFESFSKRCAIQEVSIFTTTVLLNFRRGGNDFVLALRELSRTLWESRKVITRTRGEQASSKLVFPMVVIFMVVVVLVGAPAMMMMNM
ncbi:type II secretion system F family protein [Paenibacillus crassostreae]|uniref:Type II secretion protein F n=1 Tax=Paenibacillus crassostreae TaxID=1763538 RepID=A0A167GKQ3_9BACL|nr:type II secretion system F family protein [Paenibacillus crassostreae]AOZ92199.1 type II secretion protein F [Paenibacillus crassostreae]OAB77661.1 type II secretion protein F [Paenibacillus crassostreae]